MNHWVKKTGIINSEGQMIALPTPNFHAFFNRIVKYFSKCVIFLNHAPSIIHKLTDQILDNV